MIESFITDAHIVEGGFAIIGFIIAEIFFKTKNVLVFECIRWYIIWLCRKYGVNFYKSIKRTNDLKNYKFSMYPFPKILKF